MDIETTTEEIPSEERRRAPVVEGANYQTVYANAASLMRTPWDIRVNFGLTKAQPGQPADGKTQLLNEQQVTVIMSPQHAKVFALFLLRDIRLWEEQYGTILLTAKLLKDVGIEELIEEVIIENTAEK